MTLRITILKNDEDNARTTEVHDQFDVPGDVVEVITSATCEMTFVLSDGTQIESTDIQ